MSSTLCWEPTNRDKGSFPDKLKFALRKKYGNPVDSDLGSNDLSYLEGLCHAGVDGASDAIAAIEKHGSICVREEW